VTLNLLYILTSGKIVLHPLFRNQTCDLSHRHGVRTAYNSGTRICHFDDVIYLPTSGWTLSCSPFKQWRNRFTSAAPEPNVRSERSIRRSNRLKFWQMIMPFWWRHRPPDFRFDAEFALHFNQRQNRFTSTAPEPNMRSEPPTRRSNRQKFGHLIIACWWRHRPPDFRFDAELLPLLNNGEIVLHPLLRNQTCDLSDRYGLRTV